MSAQGHKHSASSSQNLKAQLATAYNELGKELSSTKIRVVGNYTLGKVIGEGASCACAARGGAQRAQGRTERCGWARTG